MGNHIMSQFSLGKNYRSEIDFGYALNLEDVVAKT